MTNEIPELSPVDKLIADIDGAMHEWAEKQQTDLKDRVHAKLDEHSEIVLLKLMGFSKDIWGRKWTIDTCNGHSGESVISDYLKQTQVQAIKDWLDQVPLPKLTNARKKQLAKEMQRIYNEEIRRHLFSTVAEYAQEDLNRLLSEVLTPTLVEKYRKTQKLLSS